MLSLITPKHSSTSPITTTLLSLPPELRQDILQRLYTHPDKSLGFLYPWVEFALNQDAIATSIKTYIPINKLLDNKKPSIPLQSLLEDITCVEKMWARDAIQTIVHWLEVRNELLECPSDPIQYDNEALLLEWKTISDVWEQGGRDFFLEWEVRRHSDYPEFRSNHGFYDTHTNTWKMFYKCHVRNEFELWKDTKEKERLEVNKEE